ncbi:phytanoyl-CoA dioxygenase family protein [Synechococcus sp. MIT S9503]|uniref:phytanoyl-CoA dioxygenase family protein n=1 Tax=Synechococcus sp. MIT S9503 TaxID=3082547 RepID=UPI0039A5B4E3
MPQLLNREHLAAIKLKLLRRNSANEQGSDHEALLGIQADGQHLSASRFDDDVFDLLTNSSLVDAVKRVSGLDAIRPFQFDLLTKAPGGAGTPWHRDRDFLPIDSQSYTCWIPLDPVPDQCTLVYAEGTAKLPPEQSYAVGPNALQQLLERHGKPIRALPEMLPGDVDIHQGQVWHYGPANTTRNWRQALGVAFVEDGTRLCMHPQGFSGPAGAQMRTKTLLTLFGKQAEGQFVTGPRHPRL